MRVRFPQKQSNNRLFDLPTSLHHRLGELKKKKMNRTRQLSRLELGGGRRPYFARTSFSTVYLLLFTGCFPTDCSGFTPPAEPALSITSFFFFFFLTVSGHHCHSGGGAPSPCCLLISAKLCSLDISRRQINHQPSRRLPSPCLQRICAS